MTHANPITRLKDASEEAIAAMMRRRLLESAAILARIVRRKSGALLKLDQANQDTAKATREVCATVIAAQRTMEMKDQLDPSNGRPDELTAGAVAALLELNDAQIMEFLGEKREAPGRSHADRGPSESGAARLVGDRQ